MRRPSKSHRGEDLSISTRNEWHGLPVALLSMDTLWPLTGYSPAPSLREKVRNSIAVHGMVNPLIVVPASVDHMAAERRPGWRALPEGPRIVVVVGNNRYWALKELDYRTVRCAVAQTISEARELADISRATGWPDKKT